MKKIIDFLRKIGLIHVGSGNYYTGEFDSRKDLKKEGRQVSGTSDKGGKKKGIFMFRFVAFFAVLFLIFALVVLGFSFWFFVVTLAWVWFVYSIKKSFRTGLFVFKSVLIYFSITFFVTLVIVIFTTSSNSSSPTTSADKTMCRANNLSKKINDRVTTDIVDKSTINDKTKKSYDLSELDNLAFGYEVKETAEGEYVLSELCEGEKTLSSVDFEDDSVFHQDTDGFNSSGGNHTNFTSEQSDGSFSRDIESPGDYTVYTYASSDGEKWYIAGELQFQVK